MRQKKRISREKNFSVFILFFSINTNLLFFIYVFANKKNFNLLLKQLIEEKEKLASANNQFHHKLADYFRKKKPDDTQTQQQLFEKNSPEQEQRYQKQLGFILFSLI